MKYFHKYIVALSLIPAMVSCKFDKKEIAISMMFQPSHTGQMNNYWTLFSIKHLNIFGKALNQTQEWQGSDFIWMMSIQHHLKIR